MVINTFIAFHVRTNMEPTATSTQYPYCEGMSIVVIFPGRGTLQFLDKKISFSVLLCISQLFLQVNVFFSLWPTT